MARPVPIPTNELLYGFSMRIFFHLIPIAPSNAPNAVPVSKWRPKPIAAAIMTLFNPRIIPIIE